MCSEEPVQRLQFWFYKDSSSFCTVFHGSHQTELKNTITIAIYIRYLNICRVWYILCVWVVPGVPERKMDHTDAECSILGAQLAGKPCRYKCRYGQTHSSADIDVQGWGLWTDTVIFMGLFWVSHSGFELFLFNVVYRVFLFLSFYVPWLTLWVSLTVGRAVYMIFIGWLLNVWLWRNTVVLICWLTYWPQPPQ